MSKIGAVGKMSQMAEVQEDKARQTYASTLGKNLLREGFMCQGSFNEKVHSFTKALKDKSTNTKFTIFNFFSLLFEKKITLTLDFFQEFDIEQKGTISIDDFNKLCNQNNIFCIHNCSLRKSNLFIRRRN